MVPDTSPVNRQYFSLRENFFGDDVQGLCVSARMLDISAQMALLQLPEISGRIPQPVRMIDT